MRFYAVFETLLDQIKTPLSDQETIIRSVITSVWEGTRTFSPGQDSLYKIATSGSTFNSDNNKDVKEQHPPPEAQNEG